MDDGLDSEYTAFLSLIHNFSSGGFNLSEVGISIYDWYHFTFNLKQRIMNMNYDLRSLIKILHFSK